MRIRSNRTDAGAGVVVLFLCLIVGAAAFFLFRSAAPQETPDDDAAPASIAEATPAPTPDAEQGPGAGESSDTAQTTDTAEPATIEPEVAPPAEPPPLTIEALGTDQQLWPKQVSLVYATSFPIIFNGKISGHVQAPAGSMVKLLRVAGQNVEVEFNSARQTLRPPPPTS